MFVANVLVSAASTAAEIRTLCFNTICRSLLHFDELRFGELSFLAYDLSRNDLAFDGVGNKHHFALLARDALSAESDVFDFQIDHAHATNSPDACPTLRWLAP